jgi:hypothetical protein
MVLQAREDNRKLIERISRGKDTAAQSTVDFIAGMLGGATVADVGLTLLAPTIEAKLLAARGTPALLKTGLKSIQAARASGGLKASIAINTAENLAMEAVSIPMENLDRRETGLLELSAADIGMRAAFTVLFSAGLTTFAHTLQHSDWWRKLFEKSPEQAVALYQKMVTMVKEGVLPDSRLFDDNIDPEVKAKIIIENDTLERGAPLEDIPNFDESREKLDSLYDAILEEEFQVKKAEFEKLENKEGVEAPQKETAASVRKEADDNYKKLVDRAKQMANCLAKG